MAFVLLGIVLMVLKYMAIDPVTGWSWWIVLSPFAAAVAWWAFADMSGLTARREADRIEERALSRRERNMEAMGVRREAIVAQRKAFKARQRAGR